jgi:hypothetical protein
MRWRFISWMLYTKEPDRLWRFVRDRITIQQKAHCAIEMSFAVLRGGE